MLPHTSTPHASIVVSRALGGQALGGKALGEGIRVRGSEVVAEGLPTRPGNGRPQWHRVLDLPCHVRRQAGPAVLGVPVDVDLLHSRARIVVIHVGWVPLALAPDALFLARVVREVVLVPLGAGRVHIRAAGRATLGHIERALRAWRPGARGPRGQEGALVLRAPRPRPHRALRSPRGTGGARVGPEARRTRGARERGGALPVLGEQDGVP